MDTKTLILESKARFAHNSAKAYLKEKYENKLFLADQGGLWKADIQTISFLESNHTKVTEIVLIDTFNNPVKVNASALLNKLQDLYHTVMEEWHKEWKELEGKR
jgi:hypothetical protein